MTPLRLFALGLLGLRLTSAALDAAEPVFLTDLDTAKALAAKEGKQLVVEFSGRTWCPPCQALLAEVLPSPEFAEFANTRVLVHLDYPRKSERTPEKIAADPALAKLMATKEAYKIEVFPTVVLLDAQSKELGRVLGYEPGQGATKYLTLLTSGNPSPPP